jgi:hypothetical protein
MVKEAEMTSECAKQGIDVNETDNHWLMKKINCRLSKVKRSGIADRDWSSSDCNVRGQLFCRFSNNGETMLFVNDKSIRYLRSCTMLAADATYYSCPSEYYQLLIVHGCHQSGESVLVAYALMEGKTECEYRLIFRWINQLFEDENGLVC